MSDPVYSDIFPAGYIVTGIRQDAGDGHPVIITGSYPQTAGAPPQALLYRGPLTPTDGSGCSFLTPDFPGQQVTSSVFYGPNTALFNPEIGAGNIRAVGSYKYSASGPYDHGMMYEGSLQGGGVWTALDVPPAADGTAVANTLAHSTMGDLVVGNCDYTHKPGAFNGFIYNIRTQHYTMLDVGALASAYGIWQNGGAGSTSYTIAGGCRDQHGINRGLLVDYDSATGAFSNQTMFSYDNQPEPVTHFEGITGVPGGFALAAMWIKGDTVGAAFAAVRRSPGGSYGKATWIDIAAGGLTTGNSVIDTSVIGIYKGASGVQSYCATVEVDLAAAG
jgi:hypothetical protein